MTAMPERIALATPPTDVQAINQVDNSLVFPYFNADTAWALGTLLRARLVAFPNPVVISIALANRESQLFYSATKPGTTPDNDKWVSRKRKTVLRFGCSTWSMHNKFGGDEPAFAAKYALGEEATQYAIHGGGWPVRVKGVEGVIAVIVVSGLQQADDHQVIVQTVEDFLQTMEGYEPEKKKED